MHSKWVVLFLIHGKKYFSEPPPPHPVVFGLKTLSRMQITPNATRRTHQLGTIQEGTGRAGGRTVGSGQI